MSVRQRLFDLTRELGFVRVSGTFEEQRAANILVERLKEIGLDGKIETFPVEYGVVHEARLKVIAPYEQEYEVTGYLRGLSTPENGIELDLLYVEDALPVNLINARGKLALLNNRPTYDLYRRLTEAGVAGILTFSGNYVDDVICPEQHDLEIRMLRPMLTDPFGAVLALNTRAKCALDMVKRGASRVWVKTVGEDITVTSRNVLAEIPGTEYPEEILSFGAHYDSVLFSKGLYDNAAGSALMMELARYFKENPPRRTLQFVWYGSEEQGLLGSKYHVAAHKEELPRHQLMFNLDLAGVAMGVNRTVVTGPDEAVNYLDALYREIGAAVHVYADTYSSDCIPFADNGIPAINFLRAGIGGVSGGHSRWDIEEFITAESLDATYAFVQEAVRRIVNAALLPVERKIPDSMKEKVDKYLNRAARK